MTYKVNKVEGYPSPWTLSTQRLEDDMGIEIRFNSDDRATEELHVHQVRVLAEKVLGYLGVNPRMQEGASLIISEFGANAVEHGEGLRDLYLVWNPPTDERVETLDITVINPTEVTEDAPGMANPGGLVARDPNHESEGGRGMWIAYALTDGHIDQRRTEDPQHRPIMQTHARLAELDEAA